MEPTSGVEVLSAGAPQRSLREGWANADSCGACGETFTHTFRRHHCRQCERSYCSPCSCAFPAPGDRLCDGCAALNITSDEDFLQLVECTPWARDLLPTNCRRSESSVADVFVRGCVAHLSSQSFQDAVHLSRVLEQLWPHVLETHVVNALVRFIASLNVGEGVLEDNDEKTRHFWAGELHTLLSQLHSNGILSSVMSSATRVAGVVGIVPPPRSAQLVERAIRAVFAKLITKLLQDAKDDLSSTLANLHLIEDAFKDDAAVFSYKNEDAPVATGGEAALHNISTATRDICRVTQSIDALLESEANAETSPSTNFSERWQRMQDVYDDAANVVSASEDVDAQALKFLNDRQTSRNRFASPLASDDDEEGDKPLNGPEAPPPAVPTKSLAVRLGARLASVPHSVRAVLPSVSQRIQREVFAGWEKRERDLSHRSNLERLMHVDSQRDVNQRRCSDGAISDARAVLQLMSELKVPSRNSEAIRTQGIERFTAAFELKSLAKALKKDVHDLTCDELATRAKVWLSQHPEPVQVCKLQDAISRAVALETSAEKTRKAMRGIGGEAMTLTTEDGETLDAVFLTVKGLLATIARAGGQRCTIIDAAGAAVAQGFAFLRSDPTTLHAQSTLIDDLLTLSFGTNLQDPSIYAPVPVSGRGRSLEWARVDVGEYWTLVPSETSFDLASYDGSWRHADLSPYKVTLTESPDAPTNAKSIILTSGAIGVYEAQKREMMALLSRGVNVLGFNFRGYGRSSGKPNETSMLTDMTAAYRYLLDVQHVDDSSHIAVKSLCMSGVAGAHLASQFPGTHLLLDQTYSEFSTYLAAEVRRMLRQSIVFSLLPKQLFRISEHLVSELVRRQAPKWNVAEELTKVTGCIGVFITDEDVNTPKQDALDNIRSAMLSGNHRIRGYSLPGEHATVWLDCAHTTAHPQDLKTTLLPQHCRDALAAQEPQKWRELESAAADFQASVKSECDYDNGILRRIDALLATIHVMHEDTEVRLRRMQNVCKTLRSRQQASPHPSTTLSEDDCGLPTKSLSMLFFPDAPHPGRVAMDDFLNFIGFFAPIHFCGLAALQTIAQE